MPRVSGPLDALQRCASMHPGATAAVVGTLLPCLVPLLHNELAKDAAIPTLTAVCHAALLSSLQLAADAPNLALAVVAVLNSGVLL